MRYEIDGKVFDIADVKPDKPKWQVFLNGENITDEVKNLAVINDQMGLAFLYGASYTGGPYNQGHFYNRGGTIIMVITEHRGEQYFALLEQTRPLQSGLPILEFPRGQSSFGEKPHDTAIRELEEESGLKLEHIVSVKHLGIVNPDNALIFGTNLHIVAVMVREEVGDWETMQIREEVFQPDAHSRTTEAIRQSSLVPLSGIDSPSGMVKIAIGELAIAKAQGRLS